MIRRVALVGCKRGQWIRTADMHSLRVNARMDLNTILMVSRKRSDTDEGVLDYVTGPGLKDLEGWAQWTKVDVIDGPHYDVIVVLEGRAA